MKKIIKFLKAKYQYHKKGRYDLVVWHTNECDAKQYKEVLCYLTKDELEDNMEYLKSDKTRPYDRVDKMKIARPAW